MASPYDAFAAVYDQWSAQMTEDVAFYAELAREADGPIVELAVGNGRVAVSVAEATGRPVIGIDSSPAMLEQASERAEAAGVELDLRLVDMRELELDEPAALVYCPFRSLLHLRTWHDKRRVFERVATSLRPGGRFAWNAFVFDPHIAAANDGTRETHAEFEHGLTYVAADNRIDLALLVGGESTTVPIWWATRSEWEGPIDVAGLEIEALYGWFDRAPFDDTSREFVWVTRKPS